MFVYQMPEDDDIMCYFPGMGVLRDGAEIEKHMTDALTILESGKQKVTSDRVFFLVSMLLCIVSLVFTCDLAASWTLCGAVIGAMRTLLTLAIGFFLWMGVVQAKVELAVFAATKSDVNNLLRSNPAS
jgi:hypothetical protein